MLTCNKILSLLFNRQAASDITLASFNESTDCMQSKNSTTFSALFVIGEILVDESKSHISKEKALDDIRKVLSGTISSRYRLEEMLEDVEKECMTDDKMECKNCSNSSVR